MPILDSPGDGAILASGPAAPAAAARVARPSGGRTPVSRRVPRSRHPAHPDRVHDPPARRRSQTPPLPPTFDTKTAVRLAANLANEYPDRTPGSSGALGAASWFRTEVKPLQPAGVQRRVGRGCPRPWPGSATEPVGRRPRTVARRDRRRWPHRDDTGVGPGRTTTPRGRRRSSSSPARLRGLPRRSGSRSVGAHAGLPFHRRRVVRRCRRSPLCPDLAVSPPHRRGAEPRRRGGLGPATPRDRRRHAALALALPRRHRRTPHPRSHRRLAAARRLLRAARRPRLPVHGLRAGALPRPGRVGGDRHHRRQPAAACIRRHRAPAARPRRSGSSGRPRRRPSGRSTRGSSSLRGRRATCGSATASPGMGDRARPDRTARAVSRRGGRSLRLLPAAAHPARPALRALRSRLGFWLFVGLAFDAFRWLGAWPGGPARPPNPASATAGDWPVLALLALARRDRGRLARRAAPARSAASPGASWRRSSPARRSRCSPSA